jgi:hypothetical protein
MLLTLDTSGGGAVALQDLVNAIIRLAPTIPRKEVSSVNATLENRTCVSLWRVCPRETLMSVCRSDVVGNSVL